MDLETKATYADPEIKSAFDEFLSAFEDFKQANDERLAQIEKRSADVVTDDKVDRINRALDEQKKTLDELTLAAARPSLGGEFKAAPDRATRDRVPASLARAREDRRDETRKAPRSAPPPCPR